MEIPFGIIGYLSAAGMAWLGFWIYRFPDRALKILYGELTFWKTPPVRFLRVFGLLIFVIAILSALLHFISETFNFTHSFVAAGIEIVFMIIAVVFLTRRYKQKQ